MEIYNNYGEWLLQSDYDLDTAFDMYNSGRYIYCIFMCHLSLEKALKSLYVKSYSQFPPKTHNLIYLLENIKIQPNTLNLEFLVMLNKISVPTRYPDDLKKLMIEFSQEKTRNILNQTKEIQIWIKQQ